MRIKRIEIKGFKSFPDKTVLHVRSGITAVVGPNGCGKSNVFEAIRWVMGEQRVRTLRSKRMEDVIFNGSESRKPVGMAEVRLVLSNTEGLSPQSMADYDEIMISRRLFRDGESQYEINNIPCRLSDVTDFFLDTGVGRNSYAIIEQGRVDMVVASKPEDRRVLIEEAAGISRYKARRAAALKKLEQTNQNLLRISDVINEVKRQSNSLKRQASRAERYRKLRDQLTTLDLALHAHKCSGLLEKMSTLKSQLKQTGIVLTEKEARKSSLAARLESERLKALQGEKDLNEAIEAQHSTEMDLTALRGRLENDRIRVAGMAEFKERSAEQQQTLNEKLEGAREQEHSLGEEMEAVGRDRESTRLELEKILQDTSGTRTLLNRKNELAEQLKNDLFQVLQESAQQRNQRESLVKSASEINAESERLSKEFAANSEALQRELDEKERLTHEERQTGRNLEEKADQKQGLIGALGTAKDTIRTLTSQLAQTEKDQAAQKARLQSLNEMQTSLEAYDEGVRFLMNDAAFRENGALRGPLAEMVDVPEEYQKALAAALGDRLGYLVVSSTRKGIEAASRLAEAQAGRSTFIPVNPRQDLQQQEGVFPSGLTRLIDMVRFRPGYENLGEFLLGRFFVVEDIQTAVHIWEQNGIAVDLVTLDGEVLNRHGEITGGSRDVSGGEVFERRREIESLQQAVADRDREIGAQQDALNELEIQADGYAQQIDRIERSVNDLKVKQANVRKDLERVEDRIKQYQRRQEVISHERERLTAEMDSLERGIRAAEENAAQLEAKRLDMEEQRASSLQAVEELSRIMEEKSHSTSTIQVRAAKLEERSNSLKREVASARDAVTQLVRQRDSLVQEIERKAAEERQLTEQIRNDRVREKDLMQRHEILAKQSTQLKSTAEECAASISALEKESHSVTKAVSEITEELHGMEVEAARLEQTLDGLVEKILERYNVDPRSIEPPDTEPEEDQIAELRQKVESMGEVNLAAIGESRHTEERLSFLMEQEADLKKAVDSLYTTINKINRTTRERFRVAFDSINSKFQEIFPFLFRGGEARLELTNEEDLLETGVDIIARPPGKRTQNMQLLSGGEKALTAVALIFSIFLIRPSPFCLLDEVDAPLDDANLARFNDMLRKLSDLTQFLLISHNKATMQRADTLYGVTMEQPGVSGIVSVEFMDREEEFAAAP